MLYFSMGPRISISSVNPSVRSQIRKIAENHCDVVIHCGRILFLIARPGLFLFSSSMKKVFLDPRSCLLVSFQVVKSDAFYHESAQKAESARQDWEAAIYKVNLI